mmetsp:Transcript_64462/g.186845  ORF Transcript_64462/g.186845 Transcript_64462/m.186845 type:complete len:232 (-) Transcript_64462:783-1478(-)
MCAGRLRTAPRSPRNQRCFLPLPLLGLPRSMPTATPRHLKLLGAPRGNRRQRASRLPRRPATKVGQAKSRGLPTLGTGALMLRLRSPKPPIGLQRACAEGVRAPRALLATTFGRGSPTFGCRWMLSAQRSMTSWVCLASRPSRACGRGMMLLGARPPTRWFAGLQLEARMRMAASPPNGRQHWKHVDTSSWVRRQPWAASRRRHRPRHLCGRWSLGGLPRCAALAAAAWRR